MATFTASPPTVQPTLPSTDDSCATSRRLCLVQSNPSQDYGFSKADTIPAFLKRQNISCAPATIGLAKTRIEWDKHCSPINRTAYERMKPAFDRVGAMMIMSEPFFAKILFASASYIEDSPGVKKSRKRTQTCLDQKYVAPKKEEWDEYSRIDQVLPSRLRVFMKHDGDLTKPKWHGCVKWDWNKLADSQLSLHINEAYLRFFSDRDYEYFATETKNNILFQLAITMGHELAHLMWLIRISGSYRLPKEKYPNPRDRPYFDPDQAEPFYDPTFKESELGNAWEHYVFGGIIRYTNQELFDLLGPHGDLVRVNSLEYSFSHDFNVQHGKVVPGQWHLLVGRIVNAFFDDKAFNAAFWLRLESQCPHPPALTVMSILEALALDPQLGIPTHWLKQAEQRRSKEPNIAERLPDVSAETMADLRGLKIV